MVVLESGIGVQGRKREFMAGIAELKAGPTHEQQQQARVLRERLLNDLQEQVVQDNGMPHAIYPSKIHSVSHNIVASSYCQHQSRCAVQANLA